jgi:hypothetical protein
MATDKKTPANRRRPDSPDTLSDPYVRGDPIPKADAVERNSDSIWALWSDVSAQHEARFADTAPLTEPANLTPVERMYAPTAPAPLPPADVVKKKRVPKETSVDDVIAEARKANRVCPLPSHWQKLYDMLPGKQRNQPPAPPIGGAWAATPPLSKRMFLREHIEWAATQGSLEEVFAFLKRLPENEWLHMGD